MFLASLLREKAVLLETLFRQRKSLSPEGWVVIGSARDSWESFKVSNLFFAVSTPNTKNRLYF